MRYRQLGRSGARVSAVALGTGGQWGGRVDRRLAREIVAAALDQGINYLDTADLYGTWYDGRPLAEELLGEALEGIPRDRYVVGTKGFNTIPIQPGPNSWGASRYHLMNALNDSLRRLRLDHVDLYQVHRFDEATPMEETMRTLDEMVRAGKVRYLGASNYAAWQICRCNDLAARYGWSPFITTQEHYNLLERSAEREMIPFCRALGVGLLPYFPLANGLLAGRYEQGGLLPSDSRAAAFERTRRYLGRYATEANYRLLGELTAFAEARGHTLADLAIAWLLTEPTTATVITGVSSVAQTVANAAAAEWALSSEEQAEVRRLLDDNR